MDALDEDWKIDPHIALRIRRVRRRIALESLGQIVVTALLVWIFILLIQSSYIAYMGSLPRIILAIALPLVLLIAWLLLLALQSLAHWLNDCLQADRLVYVRQALADKKSEKGSYFLFFNTPRLGHKGFVVAPKYYEPFEKGQELSFIFASTSARLLDIRAEKKKEK